MAYVVGFRWPGTLGEEAKPHVNVLVNVNGNVPGIKTQRFRVRSRARGRSRVELHNPTMSEFCLASLGW